MIRVQDIPRDPRAPAVARRMVDQLTDVVDPQLADEARLLLSEVVTNAVPKARDKPAIEAGGWGLHLVETLSQRWGVREGSTHVWFDLSSDDGA